MSKGVIGEMSSSMQAEQAYVYFNAVLNFFSLLL